MVPLYLVGRDRAVNVLGLLDSGANYSTIPKEIAEFIGADLSAKSEFVRGIGGN